RDALRKEQNRRILKPELCDNYLDTYRFKKYSLSIALEKYKTISHNKLSGQLEMDFINSIILGKHIKTKNEYRKKLSILFNALDHRLKSDVPNFAIKLKASLD
ncbi:hypothetical protein, partial [Janthinobacterium sp. PSPC3-1]|uniref:hypothetical protein n=1 Tax=Janthinobacterium sp. PSPC3-1 TaxID=2804653 RepID=UPI003CE872B7